MQTANSYAGGLLEEDQGSVCERSRERGASLIFEVGKQARHRLQDSRTGQRKFMATVDEVSSIACAIA